MFSGLCGALPVNSGEVNLTRFSETFGVFSSLSLHFVLQQRQWGIQAKEAFWGKLLKKTKGGLFNWKLLGLTDTWGNHRKIQVSSFFGKLFIKYSNIWRLFIGRMLHFFRVCHCFVSKDCWRPCFQFDPNFIHRKLNFSTCNKFDGIAKNPVFGKTFKTKEEERKNVKNRMKCVISPFLWESWWRKCFFLC